MLNDLDLKEIQRKAVSSYHQDGLVEILIGFLLIFSGGSLYISSAMVFPIVFIIFVAKPLIFRLKSRFTFPRIGYVSLPEDKEAGIGILKTLALSIFVVILIGVIAAAIMGKETGWAFVLAWVIPVTIGLLFACGPLYAASTYHRPHFYALSFVFAVSGFLAPLLKLGSVYRTLWAQLSVMGLVSLVIGIVLFIQFIRTHPVLPEETGEVEDNG